jgi:DNA topoisomerase-2
MLMTDQDLDGSHIKGLLMNMFQYWWPTLYKTPGFLKEFVTPIVKVKKNGISKQFFTLKEYHTWKERNNNGKGWKAKYYKGLGTNTSQEAKEYFKNLPKHEITFQYAGPEDDEAIDLVFNKKRPDDRKEWINSANDEDFVDHSQTTLKYADFVNKELVQYSKYDVVRSIPNMVDGFKPTQRKVLFAAFKRNLKSDLKVAQFVGYISEQTSYHHGEVSLETTIVGMAQDYVGSNNINLLYPSGQFGTRLLGGKDHASSRYIFTRLSKVTRALFHPDDDGVYKYLHDEGQSIEPPFYAPVIPTVLVNGADGIGTGWSSNVPNFNPRDILANLQRMLKGEKVEEMHPWYAGFSGTVQLTPKGYEISGKIEKTGPKTIEISELPIKVWTQDYKSFLQEMLAGNQPEKSKDADAAQEKETLVIEDIKEYHTENTVHFELTLSEAKMQLAESMGLEKAFKIRRNGAATSNMMLFDAEGKVKKYASAEEILYDFADVRISFYDKRKINICEKLLREKVTLDYKTKFIIM